MGDKEALLAGATAGHWPARELEGLLGYLRAEIPRRIRDYLNSHPEEDLIDALGEVGDNEALVIPRATAVILAQVLSLLEKGHGVQIIPKDAELTTQQAADVLNVSRPLSHRPAGIRADPVPQGRKAPPDHLRGAPGVQAPGRPRAPRCR